MKRYDLTVGKYTATSLTENQLDFVASLLKGFHIDYVISIQVFKTKNGESIDLL